MKSKRRRKKPGAFLAVAADSKEDHGEKSAVVLGLSESIKSFTLQDAALDGQALGGDLCKPADIPSLIEGDGEEECPPTSFIFDGNSGSESCSASTSGSSSGIRERNFCSAVRHRNKLKRVVAVAGTVSNLLGRDYVKRVVNSKGKESARGLGNEEKEAFLFSMLGSDCGLSKDMIHDVLYHCGYDVDKAVDCLLELSEPTLNCSSNSNDVLFQGNTCDELSLDEKIELLYYSNDTIDDNLQQWTCKGKPRNYCQALLGSPSYNVIEDEITRPLNLLESLFTFPTSSGHSPEPINWHDVVKKMQYLWGCTPDIQSICNGVHRKEHNIRVDEEYHTLRESANQQWAMVKSCYARASVEYAKGNKQYASYLADKGRLQTKVALKADQKASQDIFQIRNNDCQNWLTIDMHGQHVKYAMKLLKLHLLFGTLVGSVKKLKVITGCGSHGLGKSKLKQSISQFLDKERIKWSEENRGTLVIYLEGVQSFRFVDYDSDHD